MTNKHIRVFVSVLLILYFSLFFAQKINLTTADLGRHITNGKVFVTQGEVVSNNYYSYTQPDFPVVNHHWFSGVVFYLVEAAAGFTGLSIFYVLVSGLTVFLFFKTAERKSNFYIALFITLLALPLISTRREIRPEGFSYLFLGLYFYALALFRDGKISFKLLLPAVIVTQILWVNLHLFFIMGIFVVGAFTLNEFIRHWFMGKNNRFKEFGILLAVTIAASLLNPNHIWGLLEPFNIFREYGYMVIENQSVFFMQKRNPRPVYFHFELFALGLFFILVHIMSSKKLKNFFVELILVGAFTILGFKAIRGLPIFALFFIPIGAAYIHYFFKDWRSKFLIPVVVVAIFTLVPGNHFSMSKPATGFGLFPGTEFSGEFFQRAGLNGPIFNNYDIGGYLIYYLDGNQEVFVDNRPEAYSVEFFTDLYIPAQETEEKWTKLEENYAFNTIFFYRHDATPWAQPFLIRRIQDETWVPVFVDDFTLILVKDNEENREIIERFRLPEGIFTVS